MRAGSGVLRTAALAVALASSLACWPVMPASAQDAGAPAGALAVQEKLSQLDRTQGTEATLDEIGRLVNVPDVEPDNLMGTTRFLSERDAHANDTRYGIALSVIEAKLANTFQKIGGKEQEAFRFQFQSITRYLGNSLMLREDIARCADKTAGQNALATWQPLTEDMLTAYASMPDMAKEKVIEGINIYETQKANRPPVAWVCRDGLDAVKIATEKGLTVQKDITLPNGVKGTDTRTTAAVDPYIQFVDDAAWKARSADIYKALLKTLGK